MKKFIICTLLLGTVFISTPAQANAPETASTVPHKLPSSMIDGIEVPFEVLDYAQMKYQGYAVTQVRKVYRGNEQVYRLRVDRDDIPDDYDSIILLYSLKWKLIGDEKMVAPAATRPVAQPSPDEEKTKPKRQGSEEKPDGGRGGDQVDEPAEQEEPEEPENPDLPDDEEPVDLTPPPRGRFQR